MMKIFLKRNGLIILLLILFNQEAMFSQGNLTGNWKYVFAGGAVTMQITATTITIDGISYPYKTEQNNLMLNEQGRYISYPYTLNGDRLTLAFPDGTAIAFSRESGSSAASDPLSKIIQKQGPDKSENSSLLGRWSFQSQDVQLVLEFLAGNQMIYNGESTQYQLKPGIIQALEANGWVDYPYTLSQGILTITTPEGIQIPFSKSTASESPGQSVAGQSSGGDLAWQLQGSLCYWTGSTSSNSAYSRTERLTFDGRGNFAFSNEGGISSDAGLFHSNNPNIYRGTYRVENEWVYLHFQTGAVSQTKIHMRQNNGKITELMYKDKLYAAALCE